MARSCSIGDCTIQGDAAHESWPQDVMRTQPWPLPESSASASSTVRSGRTSGSCGSGNMRSATRSVRRLPMRPAGWFIAYWSCVRCLACASLQDRVKGASESNGGSRIVLVEVQGFRADVSPRLLALLLCKLYDTSSRYARGCTT